MTSLATPPVPATGIIAIGSEMNPSPRATQPTTGVNMSCISENVQAKIEERKAILTAIKEELVERLELELEPADIDDDTFLFGGGLSLDSIDSMEIIIGMQSRFGVMIPEDDSSPLRTINTLADFVIKEGGTL